MKITTFITYLTNNIYFEFEWKNEKLYFVYQHILQYICIIIVSFDVRAV